MKKEKRIKYKIVIKNTEITHSSKNQIIEGKINNKIFIVNRYYSNDNNYDIYDNEYELVDENNFTEEEQDEIREYVEKKVKWQ